MNDGAERKIECACPGLKQVLYNLRSGTKNIPKKSHANYTGLA
jgi:hypothetical protein